MLCGGEGSGAAVNEAVKWAEPPMRHWGQRQWSRASAGVIRQNRPCALLSRHPPLLQLPHRAERKGEARER